MREFFVIERKACPKFGCIRGIRDRGQCAMCEGRGYVEVRVPLSEALAEMGKKPTKLDADTLETLRALSRRMVPPQ